jgi:hypothetical protein
MAMFSILTRQLWSKSLLFCTLAILIPRYAAAQAELFNYKRLIDGGAAKSLTVQLQAANQQTGEVTISGNDDQRPTTPFTFIWGDGTTNTSFFPASHTYSGKDKNYVAQVVAKYANGSKDTAEVLVQFVRPTFTQGAIDPVVRVFVPAQSIPLSTHFPYSAPSQLSFFTDDFFTGSISRANLEYLLSVLSSIEYDFTNQNVYLYKNQFQQYMLRDANAGGAYSLWYTDPVAFGVGDALVRGSFDYSSLAHEMGHNYTLNSPSQYFFGGKSDGNANAIFSETMAQIYQHAAGYELINHHKQYGLGDDMRIILSQNFIKSFNVLKNFYVDYLAKGKPFASWNNPDTPFDEALPTFMTLGYKFCEYAENQGKGYRVPTKRMMQFLQRFNAEWHRRFDQFNNNPAADAFRATMMVAAISHAFQKDLRTDFRALNFPVSDTDWAFFNPQILDIPQQDIALSAAAGSTANLPVTANVAWMLQSAQPWLRVSEGSGSGNKTVLLTADVNPGTAPRTATVTLSSAGLESKTVTVTQAGVAPFVEVGTSVLTLAAAEGSSGGVDIKSNTAWTVASSGTWLTVSPVSGSGNGKLTVTATANLTPGDRSATLTIRAANVPDVTVNVRQTASPVTGIYPADNKEISVFPNPAFDDLRIDGLNGNATLSILHESGIILKNNIPYSSQNSSISLKKIPAGVYLIGIEYNGKIIYRRVVKNL